MVWLKGRVDEEGCVFAAHSPCDIPVVVCQLYHHIATCCRDALCACLILYQYMIPGDHEVRSCIALCVLPCVKTTPVDMWKTANACPGVCVLASTIVQLLGRGVLQYVL